MWITSSIGQKVPMGVRTRGCFPSLIHLLVTVSSLAGFSFT